MSVTVDTTLSTYRAAVTVQGDFSGLPDGDFEVALGSYTTPGAFQAPDDVSINGTTSVTLTGRLGAGKSFDPVANTYYLWGRATRSPDETLTRGSTRITVVTTGGVPVGSAVHYVPIQATAPDPAAYTGWLDSTTSPPTLKGWNGTSWVAIGGGGGSGAVSSVFTRTGAVVAASGDYAAFYDAAGAAAAAQTAAVASADGYTDGKITAEVTRANGAYDALGAATAAQAAAIAASQPLDSDLTAIAALTTTTFGRSVLTQADAAALRTLAGLGTAATQASTAFDAAGAASTAQAAAIAAAATDATTKANAAQAASQPLDSDLTAIAALATTSFGRSFLALADAAAGRTLLGLGTLATQSGTFSGTSSGTNTGDQTLPTTLPPNGAAGGDLSGTYPNPGVAKVNGTSLAGLATGLLKNTTGTGVPTIAAAADVPTVAAGSTGPLSATDATTTNSRAPSGAAGGDLAGTYPNPTLGTAGTAGTYGDATHTVTLTTDTKGRVTAVTTNLITGSSFTRQLKTANYTASIGDYVAADTTGGAFTVTLPAASGGKGTVVLKWVAGTAAPSVALTGSDHFDTSTGSTGGAFTLLNQAATYDSDGTSIYSVRNSFSLSTLDSRYATPGREFYTKSAAALYETVPALYAGNTTAAPGSGTLYLTAIYLPAGTVVSNITYASNGGATSPTHWWFGLFDSSRVALAFTADQLTSAWGSFTMKTLAIASTAAGAASSYTITTGGLYYLGAMVVATTVNTFVAGPSNMNNNIAPASPALNGLSTSGLTTVPGFPFTGASLNESGVAGSPTRYAYVS